MSWDLVEQCSSVLSGVGFGKIRQLPEDLLKLKVIATWYCVHVTVHAVSSVSRQVHLKCLLDVNN